MRRAFTLLFGMAVVLSYTVSIAQDHPGPPKRLQLVIEDVKPGKNAAHEKSEVAWLASYQKAKVPVHALAMTAMTGRNETWFIISMGESWTQFASWNKEIYSNRVIAAELDRDAAFDGELINSTRTYFIDYVPELSYRPDFKLGEMRTLLVDVVRVKPGHGREFADLRKAINAAHEKADMDEHMLVYYCAMGSPGGTYFIFEPLKSVGDMDAIEKWHGDGSEYQKALGEDFGKMNREFAQSGLMSTESNMFSIAPSMSWVSDDTAKVAMDFWRPKAAVAKAKPVKEGAATPAAQKEKK